MTTAFAADVIEAQLLEHEHGRIREGLSSLREAIEAAPTTSRSTVIDGAVRALAWLRRDLLPHAAWEEAWLYPQTDASAGTAWATRALRFEHDQIRELATAFETEFITAESSWTPAHAHRLNVAMARLEAVIAAHLAQEQWLIAPLLDRGSRRDLPESEETHHEAHPSRL